MKGSRADEMVRDIGNAFALVGGRPRLADELLASHARAIAALDEGRREKIAVELVALARRAAATGQDEWDDALVQLCLLTAIAVGDLDRAGDLLAEAGLGTQRARALVGAAQSLKPVGADGVQAGAVSPFAALIENRLKNKPTRSNT